MGPVLSLVLVALSSTVSCAPLSDCSILGCAWAGGLCLEVGSACDSMACGDAYKAAFFLRHCNKTEGMATIEEMVSMAGVPATDGYVHLIETSPGDHCLEVHYPGGNASAFWKSDGWKYGPPVRPEWVQGACDRKKWTSIDDTEHGYDGWTSSKNAPDGEVVLIKYGYDMEATTVNSSCVTDIAEAAVSAGQAALDIKNAVGDCKSGKTAACTADISGAVSALASATSDISAAVTDCGGKGSACTTDISAAASALAGATSSISSAVDDCKDPGFKCAEDIIAGGVDIGKAVADIAKAVKDCK